MGLYNDVLRILQSRVPLNLPTTAVTTFFPNLANPVLVTSSAVANTYGNNSTALLAAGNTLGLWVVGIYATAFSAANIDYHIQVNADPTGAAPVTVLGSVPFWTETTVVADQHQYMEFYKPVYFPPGNIICVAASSGNAVADTVTCWVICIQNMVE